MSASCYPVMWMNNNEYQQGLVSPSCPLQLTTERVYQTELLNDPEHSEFLKIICQRHFIQPPRDLYLNQPVDLVHLTSL